MSFLSNLSGYHNLFSFWSAVIFFAEPCKAFVFQILGVFQLSQEKLKTMGRGGGWAKKVHYERCANGELCEKIYAWPKKSWINYNTFLNYNYFSIYCTMIALCSSPHLSARWRLRLFCRQSNREVFYSRRVASRTVNDFQRYFRPFFFYQKWDKLNKIVFTNVTFFPLN